MPPPSTTTLLMIRPQGSRRVYRERVDPNIPLGELLERFLRERFHVVPRYLVASLVAPDSAKAPSTTSVAILNMCRTPAELGLKSGDKISLNWATSMRSESAVRVAARIIMQTAHHLRKAAMYGVEGVCYWAAVPQDDQWKITSVIRPRTIVATAVRVDVSAEENRRLEAALPTNAAIVAQVHSHLGPAFHSDRDDRYPFSLEPGFLSIVVPHGANDSVHWPGDIRIFELQRYPQWREWSKGETCRRLMVIEGRLTTGSYMESHRNAPATGTGKNRTYTSHGGRQIPNEPPDHLPNRSG